MRKEIRQIQNGYINLFGQYVNEECDQEVIYGTLEELIKLSSNCALTVRNNEKVEELARQSKDYEKHRFLFDSKYFVVLNGEIILFIDYLEASDTLFVIE